MIIILTGKSGSGKDTILKCMCDKDSIYKPYTPIISYTTRPKRDGEIDGVDYNFVEKSEFLALVMKNYMFEFRSYETELNGVKDTWFYGTPRVSNKSGNRFVVVTDLEGAEKYVNHYGKDSCFVVYVDVPDDIRKYRAICRGGFDETEWNRRLVDDTTKFSENNIKNVCDGKIDNIDELSETVYKILSYANIKNKKK